ncbi:MAG: hypothetical protein LIO96_07910 [Lachnospiraceae bacterium]|nr:hypothetical protein [Lachnospiraceae bacterium]
MEQQYKEVDFHTYCPTCKYAKQAENEKPCDACLEECVNVNSHKPVKWEEKE